MNRHWPLHPVVHLYGAGSAPAGLFGTSYFLAFFAAGSDFAAGRPPRLLAAGFGASFDVLITADFSAAGFFPSTSGIANISRLLSSKLITSWFSASRKVGEQGSGSATTEPGKIPLARPSSSACFPSRNPTSGKVSKSSPVTSQIGCASAEFIFDDWPPCGGGMTAESLCFGGLLSDDGSGAAAGSLCFSGAAADWLFEAFAAAWFSSTLSLSVGVRKPERSLSGRHASNANFIKLTFLDVHEYILTNLAKLSEHSFPIGK